MTTWFTDITRTTLWQPNELFLIRPPVAWELMELYILLLVACLVSLIVAPVLKNRLHPMLRSHIVNFAWTQLIIGAFLLFFRYYRVPYLGMDFLRTAQELWIAGWIVYTLFFFQKKVRAAVLEENVASRRNKYLPKNQL